MEGYKTCSKCGEAKPRTDFYKHKSNPDGLAGQCKVCRLAVIKARTARLRKSNMGKSPDLDGVKRCSDCKQKKPKAEFNRDTGRLDGLQVVCRACSSVTALVYRQENAERISEKQRARAKANPERNAAKQRAWRKANPERHRANATAYREANKDRLRELRRAWKEENRDRVREQERAWKAANPEKAKANINRRRARRLNNGVYLVTDREMKRLYASPCVACGACENITADHIIPIARGGQHSIGNLQPLCGSCNSSKCDRLMIEWRVWRDELAGPSVGAA